MSEDKEIEDKGIIGKKIAIVGNGYAKCVVAKADSPDREIIIIGAGETGLKAQELLRKIKLAETDTMPIVIVANEKGEEKISDERLHALREELLIDENSNIFRPRPDPYLITAPPMQAYEDMSYSHLSKADRNAKVVSVRKDVKIGRNAPCPCGSGKKNKKCCNIQ